VSAAYQNNHYHLAAQGVAPNCQVLPGYSTPTRCQKVYQGLGRTNFMVTWLIPGMHDVMLSKLSDIGSRHCVSGAPGSVNTR
jgi:hypothetical protein